ncbi:unnamed protein product, partial [Prorocentrum cordatum]
MRRPDFFRTAPLEVQTLSPGPVVRPDSFFDGPEARRGPPGAENSEKLPVLIFYDAIMSGASAGHCELHTGAEPRAKYTTLCEELRAASRRARARALAPAPSCGPRASVRQAFALCRCAAEVSLLVLVLVL